MDLSILVFFGKWQSGWSVTTGPTKGHQAFRPPLLSIFLNVWSEVSKLLAWRRSFCGALIVLIPWQPDTIDRQWNLVSSFDDKWKPSLTNWCVTSKCVAAPLKNYKIPNHLQSEMYLLAWGWRLSPDWRQQHNQGCKSPGSLRNSHKK